MTQIDSSGKRAAIGLDLDVVYALESDQHTGTLGVQEDCRLLDVIGDRMVDRNAFDTATRIAAGDDKTNYDKVAITLHWLTALLVIVQFVMAVTWDYFPHDTSEAMQSIHVSLGVLLTVVVIARIAWRLMPGHQRPAIVSGWVKASVKGGSLSALPAAGGAGRPRLRLPVGSGTSGELLRSVRDS